MKTAPQIRLIATDLDGTILGSRDEYALYAPFRERLSELVFAHGAVWVVCTGRSMPSFRKVFVPLRRAGIMPDYVILKHAFIYSVMQWAFLPHWLWNMRILKLICRNWLRTRRSLQVCRREILDHFRDARTIRHGRGRLCMKFREPANVAAAAGLISKRTYPHESLLVFKRQHDIEVRSVPFTKGLSLMELARRLGISSAEILAIGDGFNDITMLDGEIAKLTACPSNASAKVMEVVRDAGGHISRHPALAGVIEAMDAYAHGTVCSDLPGDFQPSAPFSDRSNAAHGRRGDLSGLRGTLCDLCLFGMSLVTIVLVLANYGLLGRFSRLVMGVLNGSMMWLVTNFPFLQ